jgi:hypothetical protein
VQAASLLVLPLLLLVVVAEVGRAPQQHLHGHQQPPNHPFQGTNHAHAVLGRLLVPSMVFTAGAAA